MFKRRDRRMPHVVVGEFFFPRGGWKRAAQYVVHRLRRLPDPPHRVARGVFAGVFISFSPFFGLHFFGAWLIAWALRGNILAALLATFFGNPVTTPLIALGAVELGHKVIGGEVGFGIQEVLNSFGFAGSELWDNFLAIFTAQTAHWEGMAEFFWNIFLPYLVGGLILGPIFAAACYYATLPIVAAYQRLRDRQRRERVEKAIERRRKAAEKERKRGGIAERRAEDQQ